MTNLTSNSGALVRDFFLAAGVNLSSNLTQVFFNDRTGILMVRASMIDLDIIEQAVEVLNVLPPQVLVEAKFAEISQSDNRALGFDIFWGNTLFGGGKLGAQGGTAPSYPGAPSVANPSGIFPYATPLLATPNYSPIPGQVSDGSLTSGVLQREAGAPIATITGILTDPQFRMVIRALEQRDGTDLLIAPKVITTSGRQAQIQVTDILTIVNGTRSGQQGAAGGGGGAVGGGGAGGGAGGGVVGASITPTVQSLPTGPTLDVLPYVSADGFTIQMTLIPAIVQFVGYDPPGDFAVVVQSVGGGTVGVPLTARLPLPHTRVRQVVTSCIVWDGQTVMLGGLISEDVRKIKDKIPVLGDLPIFGRFFRSESNTTNKKNLVIFVTPTIIDPAGNRVHTEEEMPFVTYGTAPQPPLLQP